MYDSQGKMSRLLDLRNVDYSSACNFDVKSGVSPEVVVQLQYKLMKVERQHRQCQVRSNQRDVVGDYSI